MDELQQAVLRVLAEHRGPGNRISRPDLVERVSQMLGRVSDRSVRRAIEWLRANDPRGAYIVASYPSGGLAGYFMGRTPEEVLEYLRPDWHRISQTTERLNAQEKLLREPQTADVVQMEMM